MIAMLYVLGIGLCKLQHSLKTSKAHRLEETSWLLAQIERQANLLDSYLLEGGDLAAAA